MTCDKALDLISARLDGELTAREEAALTAHLQECSACRAIANDMKTLHSTLTQVGEVAAPAELSQSVLRKIKAERTTARRRFIRRLSGLAACLLLCVGVFRVADAASSQRNRPSADPNVPSVARHIEPQPVALNRLDAYSLPVPTTAVAPFASLLNSADGLEQFLAQLPQTDLTAVTTTYTADFFRSNRLLALVVQEPSSSITHRITELTEEHVVVLRDVPKAGDCDMALWLILSEVAGSGPAQDLRVEISPN